MINRYEGIYQQQPYIQVHGIDTHTARTNNSDFNTIQLKYNSDQMSMFTIITLLINHITYLNHMHCIVSSLQP